LGYQADLARNGVEALAAIEKSRYDVVLMDVQMPEMDGLTASREITRRWPAQERPHIVAMTANAMRGDREACIAAGMDDYLTKPIRVDQLIGALARCPAHPDAPLNVQDCTTMTDPVIDPHTFDELQAHAGADFVVELVDTFALEAPSLLSELRSALAVGAAERFRRAAHSMKSNASTFGATRLASMARALELNGLPSGANGIDELDAELAATLPALWALARS
jgi:CheY-like chemotaxis protein